MNFISCYGRSHQYYFPLFPFMNCLTVKKTPYRVSNPVAKVS